MSRSSPRRSTFPCVALLAEVDVLDPRVPHDAGRTRIFDVPIALDSPDAMLRRIS